MTVCVRRGDSVEGESGEGSLHKGTKTNMRVIT